MPRAKIYDIYNINLVKDNVYNAFARCSINCKLRKKNSKKLTKQLQ